MPPPQLAAILREIASRLAAEHPAPAGDLASRIEAARQMLGELGGLAESEAGETGFVIHGRSCPLAAVVSGHPMVCQLAEALLAEVIGAPVQAACDAGDPPHCRFMIPAD